MRGSGCPGACRKLACLAVIAVFLLAAAPLAATESEIKALQAKTENVNTEGAAEVPQAEATAEPDTSVCIDADAGQTSSVNTLEDIYSLSRGNLAALLQLTAEPSAEAKTVPEEVRWTEVKTKSDKAEPAPEKNED